VQCSAVQCSAVQCSAGNTGCDDAAVACFILLPTLLCLSLATGVDGCHRHRRFGF
jgi:hypothetical protein